MKQKTILLGMSGGVDSSVAALLLKQQGYKVIGTFMKNFSDTKTLKGECAWRDERRSALRIAAILKIQLITLDFEKEYKTRVIAPMFSKYKKGFTPNPDILCNKIIKFPLLWKAAKKLGADYIATGHYARIKKTKIGYQLLAAKDKEKDQSYFLSELSQTDLSHTLFPNANLTKQEVRKLAKKHKFPNWNKKGTAGICFVGQIDMQAFLKQKIKPKSGLVVSPEGKILGTHSGTSFYTIGQKVGPHFGIFIKKPDQLSQKKWYIAEKRESNLLVVAPEGHSALKRKELTIQSLHLINPKEKIPSNLRARIRHRGQLIPGKLVKNKFIFSKPVSAIAEGQFITLYHKNQVIGSGEIRLK